MAVLLNSSNFNGRNGSHFELRLEYDLIQSQENNTSTITYYLKMKSKDGYSGSGATAIGYINSNQVGTFNSIGVNTTIIIGTRTETIIHENDGTKTISYSALIDTPWDLGDASVNGNLTLPKISRYPTLIGGQDFTDEGNPTLTFTNEGLFPVRVKLEAGGNTQLIIRDISQTAKSYTFDLTNEERNTLRALCPNSNTLNVTETVCAMNGNTELSASYKTYKMTIVNGNPVFNNFDFEETNNTIKTLTGSTTNNVINVNGYSNIKATISTTNKATAQKSADMVKYRFAIGDKSTDITYSSSASVNGTITGATNGTYNVYAIDTRNNSTLVTKQATRVIDYSTVSINKQTSSIQRDDNQVGENTILTLNGTFWNGNFGATSNAIQSVTYRFKKTNSSTWITGTTTITPTINGNSFSFTGLIASDNLDTTWDLDASYNIEVTVNDKLTSSTAEFILNSAIPTLSLDKNGVGVMCGYNSDLGGLLQVGGKIIDGGTMLWTNTSPTSEFSSQNITLSSDDYDMLLWICRRQNDNNLFTSPIISIKGFGCLFTGVSNGGDTRRRSVDYVDDTTYQVNIGVDSSGNTVNGALVPLYVIGYKTNLFS